MSINNEEIFWEVHKYKGTYKQIEKLMGEFVLCHASMKRMKINEEIQETEW